jgi:hypothetical protein
MLLGAWIHVSYGHDAFIFKGLGDSLTVEDEDIMNLLNVGSHSLSDTASHPGKLKSSAVLL